MEKPISIAATCDKFRLIQRHCGLLVVNPECRRPRPGGSQPNVHGSTEREPARHAAFHFQSWDFQAARAARLTKHAPDGGDSETFTLKGASAPVWASQRVMLACRRETAFSQFRPFPATTCRCSLTRSAESLVVRRIWLRECGQVRVVSHEGVFDSFVFCGGYRLLRNSFP